MQQIKIGPNENEQRLDRLLLRYLPGADKGFIYKMLRKKNIVLNDKKAEGSDRVCTGDEIKLYLSDDTIAAFSNGKASVSGNGKASASGDSADSSKEKMQSGHDTGAALSEARNTAGVILSETRSNAAKSFDLSEIIVYEDENVIIMNKPVGMLSQKAEASDVSLNEYLIEYLLNSSKLTREQLRTFKPAVCNRLDRNTAGLICAGCSLDGLRDLSALFRERKLHKYYLCIVEGNVEKPVKLDGYLFKDERTNKVTVSSTQENREFERICTSYRPLRHTKDGTLLEVELHTGKTHQIRAHLASIGHPIAGDSKYGHQAYNRYVRDNYHVRYQLLYSYRLVFPELGGSLKALSGREFVLDKPENWFI